MSEENKNDDNKDEKTQPKMPEVNPFNNPYQLAKQAKYIGSMLFKFAESLEFNSVAATRFENKVGGLKVSVSKLKNEAAELQSRVSNHLADSQAELVKMKDLAQRSLSNARALEQKARKWSEAAAVDRKKARLIFEDAKGERASALLTLDNAARKEAAKGD